MSRRFEARSPPGFEGLAFVRLPAARSFPLLPARAAAPPSPARSVRQQEEKRCLGTEAKT